MRDKSCASDIEITGGEIRKKTLKTENKKTESLKMSETSTCLWFII